MSTERSAQIARLQEQLKLVVAERQRIELEIKETDRVISEVKGLAGDTEIYRSTGPVLYKSTPSEVVSGLDKYKAEMAERLMLYQSQESSIKEQIEKFRKSALAPSSAEAEES